MGLSLKDLPKEKALQELADRFNASPKYLETVLKMFRLMSELERALELHFAQWDLSRGRFMILMLLFHCGCPENEGPKRLSPSDLADKLDVTRGNMTGLIDGLDKAGLIIKSHDKDDRRTVYLALSKKGRDFLEKILPVHYRRIGKAMAKMTGSENQVLIDVIDKLYDGLKFLRDPKLEA